MRLHRSNPSGPGIRRSGTTRIRYLDADGRVITDPGVLERIGALVIPPAWTDVWISPDEVGHIQAVGTDQAGRRQYIYHDIWRQHRDRAKFDRAMILAQALPSARRGVTRDLAFDGFARARALAAAFRIVDLGSLRIGSEQYLHTNGSRGLTTLLCRHVDIVPPDVSFVFPAKSGQEFHALVSDAALSEYLSGVQRLRGPRSRQLAWRDRRWHSLSTAAVNEDIRERTKAELTAKDFRTLRGTIIAASSLSLMAASGIPASDAAITRAVKDTAAVLGNTPAVARASYIDPRVFDRYRAGLLIEVRRGLSPERALLDLMER